MLTSLRVGVRFDQKLEGVTTLIGSDAVQICTFEISDDS